MHILLRRSSDSLPRDAWVEKPALDAHVRTSAGEMERWLLWGLADGGRLVYVPAAPALPRLRMEPVASS